MLDRIDEGGFVTSRHKTHEAQLPPNVQAMETTMQKTTLTIFGALLITGLAVQVATASEHHRSKAYFGRDLSEFRGTYNQMNRSIIVTPQTLDRFDPSVPRSEDPALNPSGS